MGIGISAQAGCFQPKLNPLTQGPFGYMWEFVAAAFVPVAPAFLPPSLAPWQEHVLVAALLSTKANCQKWHVDTLEALGVFQQTSTGSKSMSLKEVRVSQLSSFVWKRSFGEAALSN